MADYEVKPPPNLRSVDCCATCKFSKRVFHDSVECQRYRRPIQTGQEPNAENWPYDMAHYDICDAFEREVRK